MSNQNSGAGAFVLLNLISTLASWSLGGYWAWAMIEPKSFGRAIVFIIFWIVLGKVLDFLSTALLVVLFGGVD